MKKKISKRIYSIVKGGGINAFIAAIIILLIFIKTHLIDNNKIELIDWTILTSIVIVLIVETISNAIKTLLMNKLEDSIKLTTDYKKLASKYVEPVITYDNSCAAEINKKKLKKGETDQVDIPVICEYKLRNCTIEINDSNNLYTLPDIVKEHYDELFSAHATSNIYNQLNIRVDGWKNENNRFTLNTSRTTYFDSLVTNRAIDFVLSNGLTLRDKLEFGPFLNPLERSKLSNHIGFNGFIESADNYIVFVKRSKQLSIGKGTYGNSIGASLKTKYALDSSGCFTKEGLINGIFHEIQNELHIPQNALEEFSIEKHLISAYRDMVEGGKPQFLFFLRSTWSKDKIEENFSIEHKKNKKKWEILEDGTKFLWISKNELQKLAILPNKIIHQGKAYHMMPSASASVIMLLDYLKESM